MKNTILALLAAVAVSNAAVVEFNLSPAGSDATVGLSSLNEVPAVTNSTGSGNTVSGGITFDTATATLHFAIGYGSGPGFTNLTGVPTAMHIHGPASVGQPAGVLFDLAPYSYPNANPTNGGIIFGAIVFGTNDVAALLGGSNYVNIHTVLNPAGEVRAQLIPVLETNAAPTVSCPAPATVNCGSAASVTVTVSDPDSDALSVVWSLNGVEVQTNLLAAGQTGTATNVVFTSVLSVGTNTLAVSVTDSADHAESCSTTIVVVDTTPPNIIKASVTPNSIWPPNHEMIEVRVTAVVGDACSPATWKILSISSNESLNGRGDGNTSSDWEITGDHTARVRAERSGLGGGRVYTLTIQAEDAAGNLSAPQTVTVTVPKSRGRQ